MCKFRKYAVCTSPTWQILMVTTAHELLYTARLCNQAHLRLLQVVLKKQTESPRSAKMQLIRSYCIKRASLILVTGTMSDYHSDHIPNKKLANHLLGILPQLLERLETLAKYFSLVAAWIAST